MIIFAVLLYKQMVLGLAIICLVLSAGLLICPGIFKTANRLSKKWISTASLEKKLNQTHDIDDALLRMRKVLGFILLALGVFFILLLMK